mmetsp:Transcript_8880/g.11571  ORF Transcript_8880/g.11571 Transcript_8880/m.11571 type:complete len:402 (-) Transcript_8880:778-1983(-)
MAVRRSIRIRSLQKRAQSKSQSSMPAFDGGKHLIERNNESLDNQKASAKINPSRSQYDFVEPLEFGLILNRPNRFVMHVLVDNRVARCHCPVTGSIAQLNFKKLNALAQDGSIISTEMANAIPCLLSKSNNKTAKTEYTVEAISLNLSDKCAYKPSSKDRSDKYDWVGINQVKANRFIEHFLKNGSLSQLLNYDCVTGNENLIEREKTLFDSSRIDFCIQKTHYVEVKCPVNWMTPEAHPLYEPSRKITALSDRLIKHHKDLRDFMLGKKTSSNESKSLRKRRCSVIVVFMYDAIKFRGTEDEKTLFKSTSKSKDVPWPNKEFAEDKPDSKRKRRIKEVPKHYSNKKQQFSKAQKYSQRLEEVRRVIREAHDAGVKSYQVNLKITPKNVEVIRMFELPNLV